MTIVSSNPQTLYVTRNGLLEPLGQSQVMGYLRGLSREYKITLITYEKDEDWADREAMSSARNDCKACGIRWLPQRFRARPRFIAPALSMLRMIWLVWREVRDGRAELIHARSYIPAAVALAVNRITGAPFIFDMRALWPEELITASRLKRDSFLHRTIIAVERACLKRAATVVSLTHAAAEYLRLQYPAELLQQHIVVIPTCADLDRFTPAPNSAKGPIVHGCIGTILSGWFRTEWLAAWLSTVFRQDPVAQFDIVTRDNANSVLLAIDPNNRLSDRLTIASRPTEMMPEAVRTHSLSVMFFTDGLSKLGSAPTRLGEVLGCGLPVVANEGVGDVAKIINDHRVGVLVKSDSKDDMAQAYKALVELLRDHDLPQRCRNAAEEIFSLAKGTEAYREIYSRTLGDDSKQTS
ncbi:glycosyltransferase family 4 protein [Hoeflea sp. CAU 1731]